MATSVVFERLLAHPATRGLDLDAPETTTIRRQIVSSKHFLNSIYREWYHLIINELPVDDGTILELGSGGGFLDEIYPNVLTSDVFALPGLDLVVDGRQMPVRDASLRGIVMTNVFHHIPDVELFLSETERVLRPGGRIAMIEPWNTAWSRLVHARLHHEPMLPEVRGWAFPATGPLSSASAALPWIIAERDRDIVETRWALEVRLTKPFMPFRYLMSGGVSMRSLMPGWAFGFWKAVERWIGAERSMAVFALIVIERR